MPQVALARQLSLARRNIGTSAYKPLAHGRLVVAFASLLAVALFGAGVIAVSASASGVPGSGDWPPTATQGLGRYASAGPARLTAGVSSQVGKSGSPQPVGSVPGPWDLVFNSQFDGSSLPSMWSTGAWGAPGVTVGNDNIEQDCYDPSQVSVAGGALSITAIAQQETCGGVHQPYTTGSVTTYGRFSFTYGYMEARIWLPGPGNVADWPGFWAVGEPYSDGKGEIDVVEGLGGRPCATFHDVTGAGTSACATGTFTGGWHTFAANWEPGSITFYYDGTAISTVTSGVTSYPMFLIIQLALSTSMSPPNMAPATMRVAYVRVWRH